MYPPRSQKNEMNNPGKTYRRPIKTFPIERASRNLIDWPHQFSTNFAEVVNWGNVQICALFALGSQPSTAPLSDWCLFCFKLKLALWVTRGCAWIHVGRSVCKLAGLKAHSDHQNPKKVALHGKTAYVGLHPQLVERFTPFLLQWCLL